LWQVDIRFFPEHIYEGIWRLPSRPYTLCDVSAGGMSPTPARLAEDAQFSTITTLFNQSLLVRKSDFTSGRIVSYRSFKNTPMKIGVVPGTTGEKYAYARAKENDLPMTIFVQYASESELLPALLNHKIDGIARGEIGNQYQASVDNNLITIAKKKCNEGFAFGVDKSNSSLVLHLNQAIHDITTNGAITYDDWLNNHAVFSHRAKQLLGEKHLSAEETQKSTPLTQNNLPPNKPNNKTAQVKEPDLNPMVMV
jgi:ABC-type amino acid transport substrate-binding protein